MGRDVRLQDQRLAHRTIVGLRPQMHFGPRLDQLRGDAHAIAFAPHAAFEQIVDAKRAADLACALVRMLEKHRRRPGDDAEAPWAEPSNLRDHFFGKPVAEILLRGIAAEVRERQDREPDVDDVVTGPRIGGMHDVQIPCDLPALGFHGGDKAVAAPMKCFDEARVVGVVAERAAEPLDGGVQTVVEVNERALWPEALSQLLPRDDVPRTLQHHGENLERLILKPDANAALSQLAGAKIHLERPEPLHDDDRSRAASRCSLSAGDLRVAFPRCGNAR